MPVIFDVCVAFFICVCVCVCVWAPYIMRRSECKGLLEQRDTTPCCNTLMIQLFSEKGAADTT
jgi:hypothetical protein